MLMGEREIEVVSLLRMLVSHFARIAEAQERMADAQEAIAKAKGVLRKVE